MTDRKPVHLITESKRQVTLWKIGVTITKDGEGEVLETHRVSGVDEELGADNEREALAKTQEYYEDGDWHIIDLRSIEKVFK